MPRDPSTHNPSWESVVVSMKFLSCYPVKAGNLGNLSYVNNLLSISSRNSLKSVKNGIIKNISYFFTSNFDISNGHAQALTNYIYLLFN